MKIQVEHPYITVEQGICGGNPIIKGTRIPVWAIIGYHKDLNYTIEEILKELPILTPAQVYDALSFYYDHREEIDRELESNSDEAYWKRVALGDEV